MGTVPICWIWTLIICTIEPLGRRASPSWLKLCDLVMDAYLEEQQTQKYSSDLRPFLGYELNGSNID